MRDVDQQAESQGRSKKRSPKQLILFLSASMTAGAIIAAALVVGPMLRSPEQAAAEALPPPAKPVLVAAEMRTLSERIVFRAAIVPGKSIPLTAPAALISKGAVVTAMPLGKDSTIAAGAVLLEANGEPVFAMNWPFRPYRDIRFGDSGPDVAALQNTLAALGYRTSLNSLFDWPTQSGLAQYYTDRGYVVPSPKAEEAVEEAAKTTVSTEGAKDAEQKEVPVKKTPSPSSIYLPASHVIRIAAASHTVTSVGTQVGSEIADAASPLFNLDGETGMGVAAVTSEQASKLVAGTKAELKDSRDGSVHPVTVTSVAKNTGEVPGVGQGFRVEFNFDGAVPMPTPEGTTVMVAAQVGGNLGEVLAAPISGVYSNADGTSFVTIVKNGATAEIPVEVSESLGGWIHIRPLTAEGVVPGDQLVVGDVMELLPKS